MTQVKSMREYQTVEVSEKLIKKLQRDLLLTRIFSVISSLLTIAVLAGGFYMFQTLQTYVGQADDYVSEIVTYAESMEPTVTQLSRVDIEALNDALDQVTIAFAQVDFERLAQQIDELDVDAINKKVAALDVDTLNDKINALDIDAINETIESVDMEELSEALTNLNDASQKIREISDKLKQVASIFG